MKKKNNILKKIANKAYEFGFVSKIKTDIIERGLNEETIRLISSKKNEPEWMLELRLTAYRHWLTMEMPQWAHLDIPPIDYQAISYYADPLKKNKENKNKEIDPELMKTFEKLGIPLEERLALSGTAVDAVMDSVSVKTTFRETLAEKGIVFCFLSTTTNTSSINFSGYFLISLSNSLLCIICLAIEFLSFLSKSMLSNSAHFSFRFSIRKSAVYVI